MPRRYVNLEIGRGTPRVAAALAAAFKRGYRGSDLRSDILAGIVVGIVALPLAMALAVASGVAPQHGLYTAVVAGGLTAVLGGSMVQVSGPTAAFVVLLAPISARFGLAPEPARPWPRSSTPFSSWPPSSRWLPCSATCPWPRSPHSCSSWPGT